MTTEVFSEKVFDECLDRVIQDQTTMRPAAPEGKQWRRNAVDNLNDKKKLNIPTLKEEFLKISEKKSNLSSSERDAVQYLVYSAYSNYSKELEDKKKKEEVLIGEEAELPKKRVRKSIKKESKDA